MLTRRGLLAAMLAMVSLLPPPSRVVRAAQYMLPQRRWFVFRGVQSGRACTPEERVQFYHITHEPRLVEGVLAMQRGRWFRRDGVITYDELQWMEEQMGHGVFNWSVVIGRRPHVGIIASAMSGAEEGE